MRSIQRICALAAAAGVMATGSASLAQVGETCLNPIMVGEGTFPFDTTGFTTDGAADCVANTSADIYYFYTPTFTGVVDIDTCGSTFDTVLTVVVDCAFDSDCNDDDCDFQSRLTGVPVFAGISMGIRVAEFGAGGTGGPGVLHINAGTPPQWHETINGGGDAGNTIGTHQTPTGTNPFTELGGTIESVGDADLYLIEICDAANFSATTVGGTLDIFDTRLYLFNASGMGVTANDDVPLGNPGDNTLLSRISNANVTTNGLYYLAVTFYDSAPQSAGGLLMWEEEPYELERTPDGPGAAGMLDSWFPGDSDVGDYIVTLNGACFAPVVPPCDPDMNQDGNVDQGDVDYLINVVGGGDNPTGIDPDFNRDGNVDQGDVDALLNVVAGGSC
jgi:hypothetical protein